MKFLTLGVCFVLILLSDTISMGAPFSYMPELNAVTFSIFFCKIIILTLSSSLFEFFVSVSGGLCVSVH